MIKPVSIFISYAHEDVDYLEGLKKFLQPLVSRQKIALWTDDRLLAGQRWDDEIKSSLKNADILLLLASIDSINSIYINEVEIKWALEIEKLIIIPVIVRPIELNDLGLLTNYQILPPEAKPVVKWDSGDDAWLVVRKHIERVVDKLNGIEPFKTSYNVVTKRNNSPMVLKSVYATDKIVTSLIAILVLFCIILFGFGLKPDKIIYLFISFIGLGSVGYFLAKRRISGKV
jgi:hypothetical protein